MKILFNAIIALSAAFIITSCGSGDTGSQIPESNSNEGNNSQTTATEVNIGGQIWMTSNLDTDRFQNGDEIQEAYTREEWNSCLRAQKPAWCYYDYDSTNGKKFGRLYNWYAVIDPRGLCPNGWHVPTFEEWVKLANFFGTEDVLDKDAAAGVGFYNPGPAGDSLQSSKEWLENLNGSDKIGFNGLPGGYRGSMGFDQYIGSRAQWWTSTGDHGDLPPGQVVGCCYARSIQIKLLKQPAEYRTKILYEDNIGYGSYVRCIKN